MNTVEFLSDLRSKDIQVFIDGDRLRCNAPEGVLTPELRAKISQRKAEIIAFLKQAHQTNNDTAPSLTPISRNNNLPLSFAQQRLWFLDQLVPNNPFYNVPAAIRLTGYLNLIALEKTFNKIISRHEALRTTFAMVDGQVVQKIAPSLTISLPVINLRSLPTNQREAEAQRLCSKEAQRPFNLTTDLLFRVTLLQLDDTEHIMLVNMHHIVSDGWSIGVLIREIGALYTAFVRRDGAYNPSKLLPQLPIQYADFAYWQREWLQTVGANGRSPLQTQLSYWREQLNGISILNLPTDRPRPAVQTYKGGTKRLQLPKNLSKKLEALSQHTGVTLFMTLLAAFKILLYRYTQQEDIAVGSPIANRNRSETEGLIGFFVNSLVMRTDLSGNPTFIELLNRVKEVALGAYAHQDLPFEKLVEELHPERKLNQNPLFQVVFALQNAPMESLELPELTLSPQQLNTQTSRFDLEFHLWERASGNSLWVDNSKGISGLVVYSTDLFDDATISRILGHFEVLLTSIIINPNKRISELPILTEFEQNQLLIDWNNTQAKYPKDLVIHQLFEKQVEQTPNAIALVFENNLQTTYQELNIRSNQLAHYLQKLGVGSETLVGICVERSLEMVVGMLGILKAGGAYVPLDPNYPQERLSFMLKDAQVPIVLTQQQWFDRLGNPKAQVICLDTDWEIISKESTANSISDVTENNLAYVIYTSGSTGQPKGVEIEHKGLLNLVFWHQQAFQTSPIDKTTQIFGVAFDGCVWEIWTSLIAGATIYLPDNEIRFSPEKLQDYLVKKQITISFVPTVLTEKLLSLDWSANTALRILLTGGDKLNKYPSASTPFKVVNNYGPTENTVVTTSGELYSVEKQDSPSIGRAIANTQVYILDSHLQPVPIGVPGELYIGGDGLARGYLNRPELTIERFISNPFSNDPEARLYKTGDLVRYQIDGNIEFLGRLDEQVKIRGYRIELGEIEAVLSQHPAVLQTVVISHKNIKNDDTLVAYVAINSDYILAKDSQSPVEQTQKIELHDDHVWRWQMLYNETYKQPAPDVDPTFNIIGWNSSYTNQLIPVAEMQDWVNNQVAEILDLKPNRVLEIGCGTGLLLFRIAPHCLKYCGTDFSQASLNYIRQQLVKKQLPQVDLLEKMATDFDGIETTAFDTIIINSVVQYFPSIEYLIEVIKGALATLSKDSVIFIGDVRSLPLLTAFHASVQLYQAEPSLTCEQLQQRVQTQIFQETELVIDPNFFIALKQHFPQISDVKIELIRGRHQNELTQFRYNAILQVNQTLDEAQQEESKPLNWLQDKLTVDKVRQLLVTNQLDILNITHVPNARVIAAVKTAEWLSGKSDYKTVSQMREALEKPENMGIDPEDFWTLGEALNYSVEISWSDSGSDGNYDVLFLKQETKQNKNIFKRNTQNFKLKNDLRAYANNPLQAKVGNKLIPHLQTYLAEKLPDYMLPSAFVVLESLPLTPNGKVDRRALPAPDAIKAELGGNYVAPRNAVEEALVKIFAEVLGVKQVGIKDNFFQLGGHSLLATQLVSRVRDVLGVELPLRCVFEAPAIAELSKIVESYKDSGTKNTTPSLVPISRDSRRMKLSSLNQDT